MTLPLENITILDLSRLLPGPYCSMILSDLGANVTRVEDPKYPYSNPMPFYQKGRYRESAFNSIIMRAIQIDCISRIAIVRQKIIILKRTAIGMV